MIGRVRGGAVVECNTAYDDRFGGVCDTTESPWSPWENTGGSSSTWTPWAPKVRAWVGDVRRKGAENQPGLKAHRRLRLHAGAGPFQGAFERRIRGCAQAALHRMRVIRREGADPPRWEIGGHDGGGPLENAGIVPRGLPRYRSEQLPEPLDSRRQ